jgi:hypothetical protein
MDLYGCAEAVNFAGYATVSGTPAISDIVQLGAVMDAQKAPSSMRRLVLGPITKAGYQVLEPFLYAEHRSDGGQALREAELGRTLGFDTYMDQNMNLTHTAGTAGANTGQMKGAPAAAGTACTVDGITSGCTIMAGDVFHVTGYDQWFRVAANATASAATVILSFAPPLKTSIADNSSVTFQQTGRDNLAFHKNALTLVTRPLEPPLGGARAEVISYKGLTCRVVYDYSIMTKTNIMSIDMLYGWKTLDINLGARLIDQRSV